MQQKEKPYVFIGPGTGQRYAVVKRQGTWRLGALDSYCDGYRSEGLDMTFVGHKTLAEANAHARMVEQLFINARKGENNGA